MCFVCVAGAAFFLAAAIYVDRDRRHTEQTIAGNYMYSPVTTYLFTSQVISRIT